MTDKINQAIKDHGAKAVYQAACKALEGDYQPLVELGITASKLSDAWNIQSAAYKAMTAGERSGEQMVVNGELMRVAKTTGQRVDKHDAALIERGGRKLNGIRLAPDAAAALEQIEAAGESATAAINRLLIASQDQD